MNKLRSFRGWHGENIAVKIATKFCNAGLYRNYD